MKKIFFLVLFLAYSPFSFSFPPPGSFSIYTAFTVHDKENSQIIQCVVSKGMSIKRNYYQLTFNYFSVSDSTLPTTFLTEIRPEFKGNIGVRGRNEILYNGFITETGSDLNVQKKGIIENGQLFFLIKEKGIFSFDIEKGYIYPLIEDRNDIIDFTVKNNKLYLLSESKIEIKGLNESEEVDLISSASNIELSQDEQHLMIKLVNNNYYYLALDNLSEGFKIKDASYADILFNKQIISLNNTNNSISLHNYDDRKKVWSVKMKASDSNKIKTGIDQLKVLDNSNLVIMRESWNEDYEKENEVVKIDLQSKQLESTILSGPITFLNIDGNALSFIDQNTIGKRTYQYSGTR